MTVRDALRPIIALSWTVALALALFGLDRLVHGARVPGGWIDAATLDEVPASPRALLRPAYLPEAVRWPPTRIVYRRGRRPGAWLGLSPRKGGEPVLWLGAGDRPVPAALGALAAAVEPSRARDLPEGWRSLTALHPSGQQLYLFTNLPPHEAARILEGLRGADRERPAEGSGTR